MEISYLCNFEMKSDLYTKIVLTVIAIVLTGILIKDSGIISAARAAKPNDGVVHVYIDGASSTAFYLAEPIEVKVQ